MFKKRLAIIALIASRTCFGMDVLEIPKSNFQLPSGVEVNTMLLDAGTFKMVFEDESEYTFRPEFLDSQLRRINAIALAFQLGMAWSFGPNNSMIATDCMLPEELERIGRDFKTLGFLEPIVKAALSAKPAGAYLKVYKLEGGDYGIHLCARVRGGGGSWSEPSWTPEVTVGKASYSAPLTVEGSPCPTEDELFEAKLDRAGLNYAEQDFLRQNRSEGGVIAQCWEAMEESKEMNAKYGSDNY